MTDVAWKCKADPRGVVPSDCDWPHCDCDPSAPAMLEALQEEGYLSPREVDALRAEVRAEALEDAACFVDFVLRHTWPERAAAHGADAVHSIIRHHPFAVEHFPTKETPER